MHSVQRHILLVAIYTLALVMLAMVITLLVGLFDDKVNNEKVFEILGPAFSTIVGALVGLLGGLRLTRAAEEKDGQ
jgi:uncharacterized membrane protein YuzA (DUF378 family)